MNRAWLAACVLGLVASGCTTTTSGTSAGSCALVLRFHGHSYAAFRTTNPVTGARPLRHVHYAMCIDHGPVTAEERARARAEARREVPALAIDGVDPRVAFVVPSRYPRYVFYAGAPDTRPSDLPPALQHVLTQ